MLMVLTQAQAEAILADDKATNDAKGNAYLTLAQCHYYSENPKEALSYVRQGLKMDWGYSEGAVSCAVRGLLEFWEKKISKSLWMQTH